MHVLGRWIWLVLAVGLLMPAFLLPTRLVVHSVPASDEPRKAMENLLRALQARDWDTVALLSFQSPVETDPSLPAVPSIYVSKELVAATVYKKGLYLNNIKRLLASDHAQFGTELVDWKILSERRLPVWVGLPRVAKRVIHWAEDPGAEERSRLERHGWKVLVGPESLAPVVPKGPGTLVLDGSVPSLPRPVYEDVYEYVVQMRERRSFRDTGRTEETQYENVFHLIETPHGWRTLWIAERAWWE